MKIRIGFVSNSSSSSFVVRGVKVPTDKIIKLFNIDPSENKEENKDSVERDNYIAYESTDKVKKDGLCMETIRSFFDGEEHGEIIIGQTIETGEDGEVKELEEPDDNAIIEKLNKYDLKVKKLRTYMQYISNDNY